MNGKYALKPMSLSKKKRVVVKQLRKRCDRKSNDITEEDNRKSSSITLIFLS